MMCNVTQNDFNIKVWSKFIETGVAKENESDWLNIFFVLAMLLIFVVSVVGNLLTCVVIYYDKSMHTVTNYYLFNLAISDLFLTFAILLDVIQFVNKEYHFGQDIACKMHFFFVVALWNFSILVMTALSIERYIAICYPLLLKSSSKWKRVMKIIVVIWVIAIIETLPEVWSVSLVKAKPLWVCFTIPTTYARIVNGVLALVTFVIPLSIMLFVYIMIAFKVNVAEKSNSKNQIFNHRDSRRKVNKLIVAMTMSFLVCWLPFFTVRVLIFSLNMRQLMKLAEWWGIAIKVVSFNSWFSIVLNPILYSLMSTKFRRALKALWTDRVRRRRNSVRFNKPTIRVSYVMTTIDLIP